MQLQKNLQFLAIEFDNVLWERKELQKQFQTAMKEQKMMELMLDELEMIHEKATNKIALLESEVMAYLSPSGSSSCTKCHKLHCGRLKLRATTIVSIRSGGRNLCSW